MKDRGQLLAQLAGANRAYQTAVELVDEAAQRRLGVNPTDARCLDVLDRAGPVTAGQLAEHAGLSPAAATGSIDRLEQAGLARRRRDEVDRRRVLVDLTPRARKRIDRIYGGLAKEGFARLERYTDDELRAIVRFLEDARELNETHAKRLGS